MDIEELDRTGGESKPLSNTQDVPSDDSNQMFTDIQEAITLFSTVRTLLDYISNTDLCKTVSRREREIMGKVSEKVRVFLASTEPTYLESEEEE